MAHAPHWLKMFLGLTSLHRHTCVVLLDLTFLPFYFDLTFPVFFDSSVLMHPEHYTDLDNLDTVENDLRHSAKGSNDAYDVTVSLTPPGGSATRNVAATSVHGTLRATRKTSSHCQSVLPAPHCITQSCTRPLRGRHPESRQDRSLPPVRMKGQFAIQLFSGGDDMGRACRLMGCAARCWELDRCLASQVDTRHCLRRLFQEVTAGNDLCVFIAAPFFKSAQFAQVHMNDFEDSLCL